MVIHRCICSLQHTCPEWIRLSILHSLLGKSNPSSFCSGKSIRCLLEKYGLRIQYRFQADVMSKLSLHTSASNQIGERDINRGGGRSARSFLIGSSYPLQSQFAWHNLIVRPAYRRCYSFTRLGYSIQHTSRLATVQLFNQIVSGFYFLRQFRHELVKRRSHKGYEHKFLVNHP